MSTLRWQKALDNETLSAHVEGNKRPAREAPRHGTASTLFNFLRVDLPCTYLT